MKVTDKTGTGRRLARTRAGFRLAPDVARIGKGLAGPTDPRRWCAIGTVGFFDADGRFVDDDTDAAFAGTKIGSVVDVRLEPDGDLVTARWSGAGMGEFGSILWPIKPGDLVAVLIPGGSINSPGISIVGLLGNVADASADVPDDWNNDRVLLRLRVPFELSAPAVEIRSGTLKLNGRAVLAGAESI